jgi:SAM-dependent methyltransferase
MRKAEFDAFAEEYLRIHSGNIKITGEKPEFFAEQKICEAKRRLNIEGKSLESYTQVLDFGSGIGNSIPFLHTAFPNADIIAADISERSLFISASRFPNFAKTLLLDKNIPREDYSFDFAFSACVFHHIDHTEHQFWLKEIFRVLKPGGYFAIFEHNPWNPLTRHAVSTCAFDKNAVLITRHQMIQIIEKSGFRVAQSGYTLFFPGPLRRLRWMERRLGWLPLGGQYMVLGHKELRPA